MLLDLAQPRHSPVEEGANVKMIPRRENCNAMAFRLAVAIIKVDRIMAGE